MDYIRLGKTGLKVSRICLGCMTYGSKKWRDWILEEPESKPFFAKAIESGINFFDTADVYSQGVSEEVTGRALKELKKRHEVVIATKLNMPMGRDPNNKGLSRKHVMEAVDASLKRLGTDYIDLYQIHRFDPDTPIEETVDALNDVVRAGKALYLGASSMYAWQFMKMLSVQRANGYAQFVSMQNHYNMVYREEEREMIPLCLSEGIGVIPWSPLARGFLTGNRKPADNPKKTGATGGNAETARAASDDFAHNLYYTDQDFQIVERVTKVASKHGRPNAQIALAWLLQKPGVTAPIVGASKPGQLEDAIAALEVKLDADDVKLLEEPYKPKRVMGHV